MSASKGLSDSCQEQDGSETGKKEREESASCGMSIMGANMSSRVISPDVCSAVHKLSSGKYMAHRGCPGHITQATQGVENRTYRAADKGIPKNVGGRIP